MKRPHDGSFLDITLMKGSMQTRYARRLQDIQPFRVMRLLARANELARMGHEVVHMEVGEPDFATPEPIVQAGLAALSQGRTKYTPAQGIPELREAISGYYESDYGLNIDPARILVTAGGSGALLMLSALLINPGDGLLLADPAYPCNRHFLKAFNGEGQLVPVNSDDDYQLSSQLVRTSWRDNTRGVLVASPSNPTGSMLKQSEMRKISSQVKARSGCLIVDEIYHGLSYGREGTPSVLAIDDDAFVVNSFSKYFGMTGWRLGWMVVPQDAVSDVEKLAQNLFICPSSIAQYAALAAFKPESRSIMECQREQFEHRRDYLVPALRQVGFHIPRMPEGAFYVYAQLPEHLGDADAFCERLLERYFVATTPGTDFGQYLADRHVRFSYAQNIDVLRRGVERLARAIGEWGVA